MKSVANFLGIGSRSTQMSTPSTAAGPHAAGPVSHAGAKSGNALSLGPAPQGSLPSAPLASLHPQSASTMSPDVVTHVAGYLTLDDREAWRRTNHSFRTSVPAGVDTRSLVDALDKSAAERRRLNEIAAASQLRYEEARRSWLPVSASRLEILRDAAKKDWRAWRTAWKASEALMEAVDRQRRRVVMATLHAAPASAIAKALRDIQPTAGPNAKSTQEKLAILRKAIDDAGLTRSAKELPTHGNDVRSDAERLREVLRFLEAVRYVEIQGCTRQSSNWWSFTDLRPMRKIHQERVPAAERTDPHVLRQVHVDATTLEASIRTHTVRGPGAQTHTFEFTDLDGRQTDYVIHVPAMGELDPTELPEAGSLHDLPD